MVNRWWVGSFPRKIGYPNKIVIKDINELKEKFDAMNGVVNKLYVSLYSCDESGVYEQVTLDKAAFDIDWDGKFDTMVELHNKLVKLDWKHQVMFSTNGFWIYVFCKPRTYKKYEAKRRLASMQMYLIDGTSLKFGKSKEAPLDNAILGDVERITRFPFSFDKTRERWVIFLSQEDIDAGMDHIIKLSETADEKRRWQIFEFQSKVELDPDSVPLIKRYEPSLTEELYGTEENYPTEVILPADVTEWHRNVIELIPVPMRPWLTDPERGVWKARAYMALFLREKGFPKEQMERFVSVFFSKMPRTDIYANNWEHFKGAKVGEAIYNNHSLRFPNTSRLIEEGLVGSAALKYGRNFIYR